MMVETGRFRNLASWRKGFKSEWKRLETRPIAQPVSDAYRPDPLRWVCGCRYFFKSRFLICKHLVQAMKPVPPVFFLEVRRSRSTPFWSHKALVLKMPELANLERSEGVNEDQWEVELYSGDILTANDYTEESEIIDAEEEAQGQKTFDESISEHITLLREFADGLEFQKQFQDQRFLDAFSREGSGLIQLAKRCLERERQVASSRSQNPRTWDTRSSAEMLYKARPSRTHS
ncbi:hypothetical protein DFJ43DRAFT_1141688 [Lentinula guzmanii]|uniref:SWIM-type domain-containing protein n=1 Tax=Lentinula guzmanii TaxID=2804957 RepID=A0AA38J4Q6_9AGAR|nr:hypothetical protein DFJ43DRAFT_1141688 [Lentinula guzmanii]